MEKRLNQDFQIEVSIGAEVTEIFDFTTDAEKDAYIPFRNLYIFNDNVADLELYINREAQPRFIPKSSIFSLEAKKISRIKVKNKSTTTTANIVINTNNDYSELELLKKIAGIIE